LTAASLAAFGAACGDEGTLSTIVETVVVEKSVTQVEKVVETVVVEKMVAGEVVKVVETVIVERPGETVVEKVVETVVVEKAGETVVEKVVETVIVEKEVKGDTVVEVVEVEKEVVVVEQVIVTAVPMIEGETSESAAPTPTPGAVAAPSTASGHLRVSTKTEPPIFRVSLSGRGWSDALLTRYGVFESLIRADHSPPPDFGILGGTGIATDWEVASDQSTITFTIREGIPFHNGYGELTAYDIEFSFNDAIREGSIFTRAAPFSEWQNRWEATDDTTVVLHLNEWNGQWGLRLSNAGDTTVPIVSKKAFEELGSDVFNVTDMGTGPFQVRTWETDNKIELDRFADYFRADGRAGVETLTYITMPEVGTQQAAMEAGELDIATGSGGGIDPALVRPWAASANATVTNIGPPFGATLNMSGNYWSNIFRDTGEVWGPFPGDQPDKDHPWIGDPDGPGCDRVMFSSVPPPDGSVCEQMENARKVRWAMAMAIDRDLLVDTVMDGLGRAAYTDGLPDSEFSKDQPGGLWHIPYDPDKAKQYLAEAGYPDGFDLHMWDGVDYNKYLAEPVAQMFEDVGIKVTIDSTAYDAYRPRFVDRSIDFPYFHGGDIRLIDSVAPGGRLPSLGGVQGIEIPNQLVEYAYANKTEPDRDKRIQNNIYLQDFKSYWMMTIPTVYPLGLLYLVGPGIEWDPHQSVFGFFNSPERITINR
jgi:ABC-type transport system substrate-binding protein